jgi:CheY-like chemotaxis protein
MNRGNCAEVEQSSDDDRFGDSYQGQNAYSADEVSIGDFDGVVLLLVEDDPVTREALEVIFTYYGAQVCSAESVRGALEQFEENAPTLVISDIGLPQGDGYSLLRTIRSREERDGGGHVPAIAISGFPSHESGERARQAGFDAFLGKPVETRELLKVARSLVDAA